MARKVDPLLCPVGVTALHLLIDMHIDNELWGDIDWTNASDWHNLHLFYGEHPKKEMSYKNHASFLSVIFQYCKIFITKLNHAMRGHGARDLSAKKCVWFAPVGSCLVAVQGRMGCLPMRTCSIAP